MAFLWSDAWLLQAIAVASRHRRATLAEVLAAADSVNHALPTDEELHGALLRLTTAGFVDETDRGFQLTRNVPTNVADALAVKAWASGRDAASAFLGAEPWKQDRDS
jgi:hypothetical protein